MREVHLFVVEGVVGSGKTTQVRAIAEHFQDDPRVVVVEEPVEDWERLGLLDAMYKGQMSKSAFQFNALSSRMRLVRQALRSSADVVVLERSPFSDYLVFARSTLEGMDLVAYASTFQDHMDAFLDYNVKATFVYLKLPTDTAMERVHTRGRASEVGDGETEPALPAAYQELLANNHETLMHLATKDILPSCCRGDSEPVCRLPNFQCLGMVIDGTANRDVIQSILVKNIDYILEDLTQGRKSATSTRPTSMAVCAA